MGAKGNQFWKARSSHGRKPIYSDPEVFEDAIYQYFEWVHENPLVEMKAFCTGGEVIQEPLPKLRAMTLQGMTTFVGISMETLCEYRKRDGFAEVIKNAEVIIYDQKFAGASAGLFNANIIARDLGLRDTVDSNVTVRPKLVDLSGGKLLKEFGVDKD